VPTNGIPGVQGVFGGDSLVYYRGGTSNNFNYDADYMEFYNDGSHTGFSSDANGGSHVITNWQFTNSEHTQMTFDWFITNSSVYHFVTWDIFGTRINRLCMMSIIMITGWMLMFTIKAYEFPVNFFFRLRVNVS
jgi:hypothetical protein